MLLKGKTVIVTGVGPGMGSKLALIAASEGAKVALAARSEGFVREIAAEIARAGGEAVAVPTDVADPAACERLAAATLEAFGTITSLVNSAYRANDFVPFEDRPLAEWEASMNVTYFGALRMVHAVLPAMKAQGGGAIVNVSTKSSLKMTPGNGEYGTAKAALNAATRQLATELGSYGIRVNTARMGWLWGAPAQGALRRRAEASGRPLEALVAEIEARIPLGRIPTDDECAKSVLFLLSDYATAVTGAALDINGGEYMPL